MSRVDIRTRVEEVFGRGPDHFDALADRVQCLLVLDEAFVAHAGDVAGTALRPFGDVAQIAANALLRVERGHSGFRSRAIRSAMSRRRPPGVARSIFMP